MPSNQHFMAIGLVIAAASLAPVGDLFAKVLSASYAAIFICFGRYLAGGVIGLGVLLSIGQFRPPPLRDLSSQCFRAAIAASSIVSLIAALKYAPLADVMAGFYLGPVMATALSAAILEERLPPAKTFGSILAVMGAIAILNPTGSVNLGGVLAIVSGLLFAIYLIAAKLACNSEDGASAAVVQSFIAAALTAPLAFSTATEAPSWSAIGLFAMIGVISIVCQGATLIAHRWADASTLAPFFYAALVSSVGLGAFVLNEAPSPAGLLGILAIASGGVMVAMADHKAARTPPLSPSAQAA